MAFTGRSCINTAAIYNDEPIDVALAVPALNRCIGLLGDMGLNFDDVEIDAIQANTFYPTSDHATSIKRVWPSERKDQVYIYWQSDDPREIMFRDPGQYTVRIKALIPKVQGIDTPIDAHPIFEEVFTSFLIGFAKLEDDDTNPDGHKNLDQTFREAALKAYSELVEGTKHKSTAFKTVRR